MSSSLQSRLDRLLPHRSKPTSSASQGLAHFEQEIVDYNKQQERSGPVSRVEGYTDDSLANKLWKDNGEDSANHECRSEEVDQVTNEVRTREPTFIPDGVKKGGRPISKESGRHANMSEPKSSSHDLIGSFCVWAVVAKFPYKYLYDPNSEVSARFFGGNKIYQRNWTLYYIYGPTASSSKPLLLVPIQEFQRLLCDIQSAFDIKVQVPAYPFRISFYKDGTPLPQVVGKFDSRDDFTELNMKISQLSTTQPSLSANTTLTYIRDYQAWIQKVEDAYAMEKRRKGVKKVRHGELAITKDTGQLKRAQAYLGLIKHDPDTGTTQNSDKNGTTSYEHSPGSSTSQKPILLAFDVEAYERDHSVITEIGISTLDTATLPKTLSSEDVQSWSQNIRSRHFRIKGREQLRNNTFVKGDPDAFYFGVSEFVTAEEVADVVDGCFEAPYSAGFECSGPPRVDDTGLPVPRTLATLDTSGVVPGAVPRPVVLIGHDVIGDIDYLEQLGSAIFSVPEKIDAPDRVNRRKRVASTIQEVLDTGVLYRLLNNDVQPKSLATMCSELDIDAWQLHNAGNDARYTLEAFIKLVIKASERKEMVAQNVTEPEMQATSQEPLHAVPSVLDDKDTLTKTEPDENVVMREEQEQGQKYSDEEDEYPY